MDAYPESASIWLIALKPVGAPRLWLRGIGISGFGVSNISSTFAGL